MSEVAPPVFFHLMEDQDSQAKRLYEYTYRDFFGGIDWSFINMRKHYEAAVKRGVQYVPYDSGSPRSGSNGQYILFRTPLSPRSKARGYREEAWFQTIRLLDLPEAVAERDLRFRDQVNLAIAGDLEIHCTCPAFNWWGYRYIITQLGAAVYPQEIQPDVRNPNRRGVICKHLATVLKVLPFWWSDIARDLRAQGFDQEQDQNEPAA